MALSLDEALGMSLADEVDESIHVNVNTRQITIPESQQLFGVESDADVEVKHIIIDGRYANDNRDLSKLAWRVIYRNANKETSYYLIPSVVANENSIEMDWLIKRSVVAYKGTVDFILCAFATTSSGEVTPEWNSTLGQGIVLEGLETSAIDIGKESVDELSKILYETITARDAAANSAADADNTANSIKDSMTQIAANKEAVSQLKEELDTVKQRVANITPDDSIVGGKPWSSKHIIDMLCPPLEESGNPVVCYPVSGYPLNIKAKLEPVQEGSGTPYPAGGGKNQLNPAEYEAATKTINGITFTRLNTGEVVVNGTATGTAIYILISNFSYGVSLSTDKNWSVVGENVISAQGLVSGVTILKPSDSARLYIRVESGIAVKTTVQPQIEKGNTPTTWAPYENIRPIKGRDSVTVERCGENILNPKAYNSTTTNGITFTVNDDKSVHITGTSTGRAVFKLYSYNYKMSLPDGKYTFSTIANIPSGVGVLIGCYYKSELPAVYKKNLITLGSGKSSSTVSLSGVEWLDGYIYVSSGNTVDITLYPMLVPGSTPPTTYTPYTGQTNTLTLPETVYGGEVDAVTGDGNENTKIITLDGTTNKFILSGAFWNLPQNSSPGIRNGYDTNCSHFPPETFGGNQNKGYLFTKPQLMEKYFQDVNAFNAYLAAQYAAGTPVQIYYKLAEPVPFTATGAQPIPALSGTNTVLTDADSVTVTGGADPIKRITDLETSIASMT